MFVYFLKVGHDIPHWPVAMLLGIVLWNFFSEVTNVGITSVVNRGDVIRKINFPKYVIVLASSMSALINLAINLAVIGCVYDYRQSNIFVDFPTRTTTSIGVIPFLRLELRSY